MNHLPEFLTLAGLHLLALMSPGPDFVMISRSSLLYSRRTGVWSAVGLAFGIFLHVAYSLAGIALIISQSIVLFSVLKTAAALYLMYIGVKALRARSARVGEVSASGEQKVMSVRQAIRIGFFTNALNPKVTLFFFSVFTQVIHPATPLGVRLFYGLEMSFATFAWFALVAIALSGKRLRTKVMSVQHYVERCMGATLILLGIKVLLSERK